MPSRGLVALAVGAWLCVAATNRFTDTDRDRTAITQAAGDSFAYFEIARWAPGLPAGRSIAFHHGQRLAIPFLIGLVHRVVPFSMDTLFLAGVGALQLITLLVIATIAADRGLSTPQGGLVIGVVAFNPWATRYYLAYPGMLNDVAFVCGLSLLLLGLFRQRLAPMFCGLLLAAVARQTALVLIPGTVLWILFDWEYPAGSGWRRRLPIVASVVALPAVVYVVTARIAAQFAAPSQNVAHLTGAFDWARSSFDARTLGVFLLRAITPFIMAIAIYLGCSWRDTGIRPLSGRDLVRTWLLVGIALCICLQPLLGGPSMTGDTVIRLTSLAMVPATLVVALLAQRTRLFDHNSSGPSVVALGAILAIGSMHHETTYAGWSPDQLPRFAVIFASAAAGAFLVTWSDRLPSQ